MIPNFHIGQMRSSVQVLKNVPTDATTGGAIDSYGVLLTTRGRLRKRTGNRDLSFGDIVNNESYELITRYQSGIENDLRVDTKFLISGLVYTLDTWEKVGEIDFYYKFKINIHKDGSVTVAGVTPVGSAEGVKAIYITTTAGQSSVTSATLNIPNIEILGVQRTGQGYTVVSGTPGNLEVSVSGGVVSFNTAFNSGEVVYVLYKVT